VPGLAEVMAVTDDRLLLSLVRPEQLS